MRILGISLFFFFGALGTNVVAGEVRVAVATNFLAPLKKIAIHFNQDTGHFLVISSGSSGKLYAQIHHGAPFDVFFSADEKRPTLLEEDGLTVSGSRFTYALGRLTLWSANPNLIKGDGKTLLTNGQYSFLAMANPKTAPYGTAAQQILQRLKVWGKQTKGRIVFGENIGQTFQFVYSGHAQLGLVALSQVLDPSIQGMGSRWDVPEHLYDPLRQQATLLTRSQNKNAALTFFEYVKSPKILELIEEFGYRVETTKEENKK